MRTRATLLVISVLSGVMVFARAQGFRENSTTIANVPYDGRFIYARLKYTSASFGGFGGRMDPMWNHDYPRSDHTFPKILSELTTMQARFDASNVFTADDPELLKFPMVYLCEVGAWRPTDAEVAGLRRYLVKGGFVLVDDFRGEGQWSHFLEQLARVLPDARPIRLDATHPVFNAFYRIEDIDFRGNERGGPPEFFGVFEDNDPTRRLMMVIDYNFDISEYWEYATSGFAPVQETNEAFQLGINYIMYTLTH